MKKLLLLILELGVDMSVEGTDSRIAKFVFTKKTTDKDGAECYIKLYKSFDTQLLKVTPHDILDGAIMDQLISEVKLKFKHNYSSN